MDEKKISQEIQKRRKEQGLTLAKLAQKTGLTKGYLSKVEHARKAPPYATLEKIARALDTQAPDLIDPARAPATPLDLFLSRNKTRKKSQLKGYGIQSLAREKPGKNMVPLVITPPFETPRVYSHPGEAMIYVLEGNLEFTHGIQTHVLNPHDSVYFDADIPHGAKSLGKHRARALVVLYFYKRLAPLPL
ncbi:MAG: XRE family transcriptional regulator [Desulfovibrionales bacterium]|nr:XRE family transcriptional regulator [Desulfovibrionales bacterium]